VAATDARDANEQDMTGTGESREQKLRRVRERLETGYYLTQKALEGTAEALLKDSQLRLLSL